MMCFLEVRLVFSWLMRKTGLERIQEQQNLGNGGAEREKACFGGHELLDQVTLFCGSDPHRSSYSVGLLWSKSEKPRCLWCILILAGGC